MNERLIWLNGNASETGYLALGSVSEIVLWSEVGAWQQTREFLDNNLGEFIFGWFGYDLKNDIESLSSENTPWIKTPEVFLMVPEHLAKIEGEDLLVIKGNEAALRSKLCELTEVLDRDLPEVKLKPSIDRLNYLERIGKIKRHIHLGDIYEANYCYEYRGEGEIDTKTAYKKLNDLTKAPFSVFAQLDELSVLCASPERFLKKEGSKVFTQPIKGTIRRGLTPEEDTLLKEKLQSDKKERSENIMIVDLVRNDLSRVALPDSVKVDELCKIYTFENIHQMISTVSAQIDNVHSVDILKALFPMGSMTGAPKIRAMELMEEYENIKRGIYSGCIGYFTPNGDFDLNVVIRTIVYNDISKRSCFSVGGAITDLSTPEGEYEETILKAKAMLDVLT